MREWKQLGGLLDGVAGSEASQFHLTSVERHHHESFDGHGYPDGLAGAAIPLAARVVAVADVFDALTTARPYKQAWSIDDALAFIRERASRVFDPECVRGLSACRGELDETWHRFNEPAPSAPAHDHEWGDLLA